VYSIANGKPLFLLLVSSEGMKQLSPNMIKGISGILLGLLLTILSVLFRSAYIILPVFFLNLIPSAGLYKVFKRDAKTREAFLKGILTFYSLQFISWIISYDIYVRIFGYPSG